MFICFCITLLILNQLNNTNALFYTKLIQTIAQKNNLTSCKVLSEEWLQRDLASLEEGKVEITIQRSIHHPISEETCGCDLRSKPYSEEEHLIELLARSKPTIDNKIEGLCQKLDKIKPLSLRISASQWGGTSPGADGTDDEVDFVGEPLTKAGIEVKKLIDNGDSGNRMDVVFMGDGYTAAERDKYFSDIDRLIFKTFTSSESAFVDFLPLINVWAIFVPSRESGIGYNGFTKNTPFKLYRNVGPFRGIFTKNPGYARQMCRLTGPSGCDYPSLIANDDYYGGLGGEFAISSRSLESGSLVLKHEFGHNFAKVGEEYDGGEVYSGANSATSLRNLKWKAWLSNPYPENGGSQSPGRNQTLAREERVVYRVLSYPQSNLDKAPLTFKFQSNGKFSRWYLLLTLTGAKEMDSVQITLDGTALPWTSKGSDDKSVYDWKGSSGFTRGSHTITISGKQALLPPKTPQILSFPTVPEVESRHAVSKMVGSVSLYEYGNEEEYVSKDPSHISAYPTWDNRRRKFYRPTNAGCLMRNMSYGSLCSVCNEEVWLQFLKKVSLIDAVSVSLVTSREAQRPTPPELYAIQLTTVKLGQAGDRRRDLDERLSIRWFKGASEMVQLRDTFNFTVSERGQWSVAVQLVTPQVRNDPKKLLTDKKTFLV